MWKKDAVCSVADTIKSFLHFSVPDEGPLTEYESCVNPQVNAGQMAMAGGGTVSSADLSSLVSAIREGVSGINGGSGDIVIPVYLGGTMLDEVIVNAQQRANLRSGGR